MLFSLPSLLLATISILDSVLAQDLSSVSLESVSHGGTGCAQGTTDFYLSANSKSIVAYFGAFQVQVGSGVPITESRKNCQINVNLNYPSGLQYTAISTTYTDIVSLGAGVSASHLFTYYFSGSSNQASTQHTYNGPQSGDYTFTDVVPESQRVWSPCGQDLPLNINNQARILKKTSGAADATTGNYFNAGIVTTNLDWREC